MSEWKKCQLGDIVVLNYGKSLTVNQRINGDIPVYSSAGLTGWHNSALVNSKGIIVGRKGTIGKVYKTETPFLLLILHIMYCLMMQYIILIICSIFCHL